LKERRWPAQRVALHEARSAQSFYLSFISAFPTLARYKRRRGRIEDENRTQTEL
jgi:hypothetical protein